jgi:hypothetical protein
VEPPLVRVAIRPNDISFIYNLHDPSVGYRYSFFFSIAHFLLVKNTYKLVISLVISIQDSILSIFSMR